MLIGLNVLTAEDSSMHPDSVEEVMYLIVAASLLTLIEVRLERGRLTLSALANGAAAVLLNPLNATLVGLATGFVMIRRPRWQLLANPLMTATAIATAATTNTLLDNANLATWVQRLAVLLVVSAASLGLVALGLSHQLSPGWITAWVLALNNRSCPRTGAH
ncbi:MAG: hypothetical protein E6I04_06055 [Chloroflexi bacterium]|nr:MAG: hypothetical protein E6I04_06055 [Chloroflexota bacterium]